MLRPVAPGPPQGDDGIEARGQEEGAMSGATKTMGVLTVGTLVLTTAYTVALGSNGWLWFAWIVLALATLGALTTRGT